MITRAFEWLELRLERGQWFRRLYIMFASGLLWQTTLWAMKFAEVNADRPGIEVAAIVGAVSAIPGTVAAFAFKQYAESK